MSWSQWVPSYVRTEYKKRTGVTVDELGQTVTKKNELIEDKNDPNATILNTGERQDDKPKKIYNSTENYVPTGKLIYNADMFNNIDKKVN